jgi:hypothetical protein
MFDFFGVKCGLPLIYKNVIVFQEVVEYPPVMNITIDVFLYLHLFFSFEIISMQEGICCY